MNKYLVLTSYAHAVMRRCELCKELRYTAGRLDVKKANGFGMLLGSLDLCRICAQNFESILKQGE